MSVVVHSGRSAHAIFNGMRRLAVWTLGFAVLGCGSNGSVDVAVDAADAAVVSFDARATPSEPPAVRCGLPCQSTDDCGGTLHCDTSVREGFCTGSCMGGTFVEETAQCGGPGSTCLSLGDGEVAIRGCAKACRATMNSGCRRGFVCTGYWYTHADRLPDAPGCVPFCTLDTHCIMGERCNVRTGRCGTSSVDETKLADGLPCVPVLPGEASACRGFCVAVNRNDASEGLCASFVDLAVNEQCPDEPDLIAVDHGLGQDNLGICMKRRCSPTQCCPGAMSCEQTAGTMGECMPSDDPARVTIGCLMDADAGTDAGGEDVSGDIAR